MAFNGDGPHNKRQRTDAETSNHRGHEAAGGGGGGGSTAGAGFRVGGGGYASGGGNAAEEPRRKRQDDNKPNHVLLFTIINPMYPITVEVLHTICQSSGQVLRIVIFKKNGVQAMVEFDSVESATRAKDTLNGADIYSGCCTLKIDFAKPEKLNVHKNDADSWDYTISMRSNQEGTGRDSASVKDGNTNGRPQPLLQEPHYGSRPQPYRLRRLDRWKPYSIYRSRVHSNGACADGRRTNPTLLQLPSQHDYTTLTRELGGYPTETRYDEYTAGGGGGGGGPGGYGDPYGPPGANDGYRNSLKGAPPPAAGDYRDGRATGVGDGRAPAYLPHQQQGAVLMVYGLDPLRTNTDKLFNLMCLYGNVARIKFLKTKEGTAMVQMGDSVAVERCVQNLNNVVVAPTGACPKSTGSNQDGANTAPTDHKLQLAFSKQPYLSEVTNPYPLPDKSPSFKEYITNKNNRFMNPAMASKNRIQPPSKILHFFNTPPQVTEEELIAVFREYDVAPPKAVKLFPMKSERSSSGLLEFETTSEAVAAVMACNHAAIESPGTKFPFIMKLCFSSSRNMSIRTNYDNGNANNSGDKMKMDQDQ